MFVCLLLVSTFTLHLSFPTLLTAQPTPPTIRNTLRWPRHTRRYTVKNHSRIPQDIVFEVEKSRAMLFSGFQRVTMKILPGDADAEGDLRPSEKVIKYVALYNATVFCGFN